MELTDILARVDPRKQTWFWVVAYGVGIFAFVTLLALAIVTLLFVTIWYAAWLMEMLW